MFDENCFFSRGLRPRARVARASPAAGSQGELWPRAIAARPPTAPGGQGGPGRVPEQRLHHLPPVDGGLRPRIRTSLMPLAPGWQGGLQPRATAARARPLPPDNFFESTYPEMQRKHIPRVNEYQS